VSLVVTALFICGVLSVCCVLRMVACVRVLSVLYVCFLARFRSFRAAFYF
jgi:hypothetical protein